MQGDETREDRSGGPSPAQLDDLRADLLVDLRSVFLGRLLTSVEDVEPFVVDWRRAWRGDCLAVVQPDSPADVAAIVRWCAARLVPVVTQGGNTGLSGGATPSVGSGAVVLSTTRIRAVRHVDVVNNTITVDAGCTLAQVQEAAVAAGRLFPLSLAAEGTCTIGGNLATNAGGTAVLRFGTARELCLGLEVVTASGELWDGLTGLRKDNTGYALRDLFIGSEGTLGVITGAVLKLYPLPAVREVALLAVPSLSDAVGVFQHLSAGLGQQLVACEVLNAACVQLVHANTATRSPFSVDTPWLVLVEVNSMRADQSARGELERSLAGLLDASRISDAVIASSSAQSELFWALREEVSEAQGAAGPTIKHDVAVPISLIESFVKRAHTAVSSVTSDVRFVTFGHLGDGNLHYNLSPLPDGDPLAFRALQDRLNEVVHDVVRACSGSISAEHGLGVLRSVEADRYRSTTDRKLQHAVKRALDPHGIMNPGKFLPAATNH